MPLPGDTVTVSNEIFDLIVQSATATSTADRELLLGQALVRSCAYLQRLQPRALLTEYDQVVTAGDRQASTQSTIRRTTALHLVAHDPDHFCEFLDREAQLLTQAGMSRSIVEWLMSRVHARVHEYTADPATGLELSRALDVLRDRVCRHRDVFLQRLRPQDAADILVLTLGGVCFIAVNTAASAILTPVGVAASCGIGAGLLKDAVKELLLHG